MSTWPISTLGEVCELRAGYGFPLDLQGQRSGEYPFAKVGDISRKGRSGEKTLSNADHWVDKSDLSRLRAVPVRKGSTLFAKIGEAIKQNHRVLAGREMLIDNNAMAAVPGSSITDDYLFRFLQTVDLYSYTSSTTVPAVRKSELARIPIPLPTLPEQRRIAAILDQADALRAKRRQAIGHVDELSESIFVDMFGDPASNQKRWPVMTMGEICGRGLRNGLSPSATGTVQAKVLTLSAVTGREFDRNAMKVSTFKAPPPPGQSVDVADLLICRGNGNLSLVGKGYFATESMPDTTFPDTIIAARVNQDLCDKFFVQQVWNSSAVRLQIESAARTTNGTFKVNQTMLGAITFPVPPRRLQEAYSKRVTVVQTLRNQHRTALTELDSLFASLQSRAFRGEL